MLFQFGLARLPRKFFRGSLIPLPSLGGGRNATQSASRGSLVVQCWPDYKGWYGQTQYCHRSFSSDTHSSQATRGRKKMENETIISESNNLFSQPIQRYFSLAGGQSSRRFVPFIQGAQSPYLAQTFTTDFLSVVYLKTVYFSFSLLYIDTKVN